MRQRDPGEEREMGWKGGGEGLELGRQNCRMSTERDEIQRRMEGEYCDRSRMRQGEI